MPSLKEICKFVDKTNTNKKEGKKGILNINEEMMESDDENNSDSERNERKTYESESSKELMNSSVVRNC